MMKTRAWKRELQDNALQFRENVDGNFKAQAEFFKAFRASLIQILEDFDERLVSVEQHLCLNSQGDAFLPSGPLVPDEQGDQKQVPRVMPFGKSSVELVEPTDAARPTNEPCEPVPPSHEQSWESIAGSPRILLGTEAKSTSSSATFHLPEFKRATTMERDCQTFRASEAEGVKPLSFNYSIDDYRKAKESWQARATMYEFRESAWDVGIFPFVPMLQIGNSINILVIFIFNMLLQTAFTVIILAYFCNPQIDSEFIDDLSFWRVSVAHDLRWMDSVTQQSLARQVCDFGGESGGLYMSGAVQGTVQQILNYIPKSGFIDDDAGSLNWLSAVFFEVRQEWIGMLMCLMALIVWWVTCIIEVKNWLDCFEGIFKLPSGAFTKVILIEGTDDVAICQFARSRKLWCALVLTGRILVASILCFAGSMYLVTTLSLRDLILNAVSLELVMGLDELLYDAMMPFHARHFMSSLEPVPKARAARCFYKDVDWELAVLITCLIGLVTFFSTELVTQQDKLHQALDAVCGGYLDFVYSMDPGGAVVAHATRIKQGAIPTLCENCHVAGLVEEHDDNYRWKAVEQLIRSPASIKMNPDNSLTDGAASLSGSRLGLIERSSIPIGVRMEELNPHCVDLNYNQELMVWKSYFINELIQGYFTPIGIDLSDPVYAGEPCNDSRIVTLCNADNETGISLRQWCPHTCGCDSPSSGLILSKVTMGCPESCLMQNGIYIDKLHSASCEDHPTTSPQFQSYIQGLKDLQESYKRTNTDWYNLFQGWVERITQLGCAGHKLGDPFGDLCQSTAFKLKPIQHVCPVTCNCSDGAIPPNGQAELCPIKCVNYTFSHRHHPNELVFDER